MLIYLCSRDRPGWLLAEVLPTLSAIFFFEIISVVGIANVLLGWICDLVKFMVVNHKCIQRCVTRHSFDLLNSYIMPDRVGNRRVSQTVSRLVPMNAGRRNILFDNLSYPCFHRNGYPLSSSSSLAGKINVCRRLQSMIS